MIYHIITGDVAAMPLKEAMALETTMAGEVIVMKDILNVGPLLKKEGQKFSEMRSEYWNAIAPNDKNPVKVDDLERLLQAGNELSKSEKAVIWIWIAPLPADLCTYYLALKYFGKYKSRFLVVNIAGLPFLDPEGKLFFPKSISEISGKELVKARKLARPVSAGEIEVDSFEWVKLTDENKGLRTLEGSKRLKSQEESFYDKELLSFCSVQYQKASRIIQQAMAKFFMPVGDLYLGWRLKQMAELNQLQLQGDASKGLKDFEVKLHDEES
ncbi:MAG: DUF1835 domain-containing protein [Taibaiella sp.]|nr:DUF1835 domain-containing protein [Taibaiella sp.]